MKELKEDMESALNITVTTVSSLNSLGKEYDYD
jgi:hypothetical protein